MITNWDEAYEADSNIANAAAYPNMWSAAANDFRRSMLAKGNAEIGLRYGETDREVVDLFYPDGKPKGLAIFVHGGYWMEFDSSSWSHLAAGAVQHGWAMAMPSYGLVPHCRISEITQQIGAAIGFAAAGVEGPICISGHSAGGHLASRMVCKGAPLETSVQERIVRMVSISGLHDLRPLLNTTMNKTFGMNAAEAVSESAALAEPVRWCEVIAWVGANELREFLRQNDLLANIWTGFGLKTSAIHTEGRNHYDVIDDLADPNSKLVSALLGKGGT
jgi:arylformamidase